MDAIELLKSQHKEAKELGLVMEETGNAIQEEGSPRNNVPSETDAPAPIG